MHEWALAEGIIKSILNYLKENNLDAPSEVVISHGELQQIDIDAFNFALNELIKGTILEKTKFILEEEKAIFKCRNCGNEWKFEEIKSSFSEDVSEAIHFVPELAHSFIKCPKCGSSDFEVVKGRGVTVKTLVF